MSRVRAETPSKAQQNAVGIPPTNLAGGGLATGTGGGRTIAAGEMLAGGMGLKRIVAFVCRCGVISIRAVSLRGLSEVEEADGAKGAGRPGSDGRADVAATCGRGGRAGFGAEGGIAAPECTIAGLFGEGGRMGGRGGGGAGFGATFARPGDGATVGGRITARGFGVATDGGTTGGRRGLDGASIDMATVGGCGGGGFASVGFTSEGGSGFAAGGGIVAAECIAARLSGPGAVTTGGGSGVGISGFATFISSGGGLTTGAGSGEGVGDATGRGAGVRTPSGRCGIRIRSVSP